MAHFLRPYICGVATWRKGESMKKKQIVNNSSNQVNAIQKNPRYGMRKLSIGFVSCLLGYAVFMTPRLASAENIEKPTSEVVAESALHQPTDKEKLATLALPVNQPEINERTNTQPLESNALARLAARTQASEASLVTAEQPSEPVNNEVVAEAQPTKEAVEPAKEEDKGELATDEAKIANYSEKERYRSSELPQGNGVQKDLSNEEKGETIEGFKYDTVNPEASDKDKKSYGIEISVDKDKAERTYTYIGISDTKQPNPSANGAKDALAKGEKLIAEETTFQPEGKLNINGSDLTVELTANDLKTINSVESHKSIIAWQGKYKKNTTASNKQYLVGDNFVIKFAVNPYPNENNALGIMKVETEKLSKERYFVKGQLIRTGAYISNAFADDMTRIAGEVYHPDGTVLKDAKAFLVTDSNLEKYKKELNLSDLKVGEILFNMPKGALDDANSVFNTEKYKGIQSLTVKMYARPRTGDEFRHALPEKDKLIPGKTEDSSEENIFYTENGSYTGPVAGTREIIHNGEKVTIDKQGIARYDHYNLLGELSINLDDTKYHDQVFDMKVDKPTDKMTSVEAGKPLTININDDFDKNESPSRETTESMNALKKAGNTKGELDPEFLEKAKEAGWEITLTKGDISKFTVKAPKTAQAGDFIAIPITYTYTNGSNDTHWFHFVVKDTVNNKPEYYAPVGLPGESLKTEPIIKADPKKNAPASYELEGTEFKDDKGNVWKNVKVDPNTGVVTADIPDDANFKGGEKLFVPVKVKYTDPKTKKESFEYVKAQFIARAKYQTEVVHTYEKEIPFATKEEIDENLPAGEIVVDAPGMVGRKTYSFKQVVVNGQKGILDENGKFVPGETKFILEEKIEKEKADRKVRIGVKPLENTLSVPKPVEYIFDDTKPAGEETVEDEGTDGVITVTTTRDPKTGKITVSNQVTTEAKPKKIRRGTMVTGTVSHEEKQEVPFAVEIIEDENLEPGKTELVQAGVPGSKIIKYTQKTKNGQADGEAVKEELTAKAVAPTKQIIKIGKKKTNNQKNVESNVPVEIEYVYDHTLPVTTAKTGEVTPGKVETIVTNEYNPQTGKLETVEKTVVTPAKQKVIIGTKKFTGELEHKLKEIVPFATKIEFDDTLKVGEQKIAEAGENGEKEKTVKQKFSDGKETGTELTNEQITKVKKDRVIKVGTLTEGKHTHTEDIPFAYTVEYDENMPAGNYEVVREGTKGTRTTEWTIKNSKLDGEATVTETKAVNAVIKVGKKPVSAMCPIPDPTPIPTPAPTPIPTPSEPSEEINFVPHEASELVAVDVSIKKSKQTEVTNTNKHVEKLTSQTKPSSNKAPQTSVAGVGKELAVGGVAAFALACLELEEKRKLRAKRK